MKKFILALVSVAALIFVIGSVGAWSNGNIGIIQGIIQMVIGVAAEWLALKNIEM
jgi:hypothetical protein